MEPERTLCDIKSKLDALIELSTRGNEKCALCNFLRQQFDELKAKYDAQTNALNEANTRCALLQKQLDEANERYDTLEIWIKSSTGAGFSKFIGKPFIIKSQANTSFVLDQGPDWTGGSPVRIMEFSKGNINQVWTVDKMGRLISWKDKRYCLYTPDVSNNERPKLKRDIANDDTFACWILDSSGCIQSMANTQQVLDVKGASMKNGTPVQTWVFGNGANQKWVIETI